MPAEVGPLDFIPGERPDSFPSVCPLHFTQFLILRKYQGKYKQEENP